MNIFMRKSYDYRLYDDADDYYLLNGDSAMILTRAAAIEVMLTAADHGCLVLGYDAGIWHNPGFEPRLDGICDTQHPEAKEYNEVVANNRRLAGILAEEQADYDCAVVTMRHLARYQLATDVLELDNRRQAVFRIILAQQVLPILQSSVGFECATRAIDLCWGWIEKRGVTGMALCDIYHDDDDYGVEPARSVEHDPVVSNAWACVSEAVSLTGYCAFMAEGSSVPDNFNNDSPEVCLAEFLRWYHYLTREPGLPQALIGVLNHLSDTQLTRDVVSAAAEEFFAHNVTEAEMCLNKRA